MNTAAPQPRVVIVGGAPMSALVAEAAQPRAVVVAIHGGATTSIYFDCPVHPALSLLRMGAALGFTVVGLDRPGYGSSTPYPEAMTSRAASRPCLRGGGPHPRRAVARRRVVPGGPFGRLRADTADGHSGTALQSSRPARNRIGRHRKALPRCGPRSCQGSKSRSPAGLRELLWQPTQLYPGDVLGGITNASTAPDYEDMMVKNWVQQDFPVLAAAVRVPVQFSFGEHESVWQTDSAALAEIAAMFAASPRFATHEQLGAGHNLSLEHTAAAYHLKVFSFVEECVVARNNPAAATVTTEDLDTTG